MALNTVRPTVLITGASSGIGSELVPFFAGTGHNVVLVARDEAVLEGIAAAVRHVFRVDACAIACDLTAPDAAQTIAGQLARRNISIDILVNNAGFCSCDELISSNPQSEEHVLQVSIVALTVLTKLLLPGMIARGHGRILNVASAAGFAPIPMHSVHSAARAYVLSFSQVLAEDLKGTGVTVTSLSPDANEAELVERTDSTSVPPSGRKAPVSARSVARSAFRALIRGDRVAAPNWANVALASL
jgi:uncharacterized protein